MSLIKQEHMNPPPRTITPLPPPTHQITIEEYKERVKRDYYRNATKDTSLKKVVLSLIKDRPGMWQNGNRFQLENWRELGVDVYQRTGQIVRAELGEVSGPVRCRDILRRLLSATGFMGRRNLPYTFDSMSPHCRTIDK
ncbi:LIn-8 Domain containing [Caenorhabditis elegans]|uniref:LIn-8 Domain containing n=1 Tax=Caenorhabditis elegans TaxID=6239 RepID=H8W3W7_CAEEL|nr:LIn-8 Domain containing [Caenorhabditis elegans]CCG28270.1 LIn-8 Domain containing [Caenorhabditis elegans]|eukprot:NP_001254057.1 LIn-8 Domain containing [Caenorhabditis elegans]